MTPRSAAWSICEVVLLRLHDIVLVLVDLLVSPWSAAGYTAIALSASVATGRRTALLPGHRPSPITTVVSATSSRCSLSLVPSTCSAIAGCWLGGSAGCWPRRAVSTLLWLWLWLWWLSLSVARCLLPAVRRVALSGVPLFLLPSLLGRHSGGRSILSGPSLSATVVRSGSGQWTARSSARVHRTDQCMTRWTERDEAGELRNGR